MIPFCRFLGYFQPQPGKPEVWELDADLNDKARNGESDIARRYDDPITSSTPLLLKEKKEEESVVI